MNAKRPCSVCAVETRGKRAVCFLLFAPDEAVCVSCSDWARRMLWLARMKRQARQDAEMIARARRKMEQLER